MMKLDGYPELVAADEPVSPEEEVSPERGPADVAPQAAHVAQRAAGPGRHRLVPPRHDGLAARAALSDAGAVGGGDGGGLVSGLVSGVRQVNRESGILRILENH